MHRIFTNEKGWKRLHKKEHKGCPYNYKQKTLFPK